MDLRSRLAALGVSAPAAPAPSPQEAASSVRDRLRRLGVEGQPADLEPLRAEPLHLLPGARVMGDESTGYLRIERTLDAQTGERLRDWTERWHEDHARTLAPEARLRSDQADRALFIDTETTGLGGASTVVFLVGCLHLVDGAPRLTQLFLTHLGGEHQMLSDLLALTAAHDFLVSYNGRAFDVRALGDRYVLNRLPEGQRLLDERPHLDLLHPARRIWRNALDDCRLATLERDVLQRHRGHDIDSASIPGEYYAYLRSGRTDGMRAVIRHNEWDVITLALLGARMLRMLSDPGDAVLPAGSPDTVAALRHGEERAGLGALHAARGDAVRAEAVMRDGLQSASAVTRYLARKRLASLHKKQGETNRALSLWQMMIEENALGEPHPYHEIAKVLEHQHRDHHAALAIVERALAIFHGRPDQRPALEKRKQRLEEALLRKERARATTSRREPPSC
ncbi:MAG: hypothetical protein EB084_19140 [Proteobacteria bacterium]|nr:hypothetical protein [Pseudomonadota bacterium]